MGKKSLLQKNIISFYREALKYTHTLKPVIFYLNYKQARDSLKNYLRSEFKQHKDIPRIKINRIEFLLRQGRNKLLGFKSSNIDNISHK